jgi:hypothetical protein
VNPTDHSTAAYDASQDDPRQPGHVHLRVTLPRKSAWVRAARPRKLVEWITQTLDREAKYEPTEH